MTIQQLQYILEVDRLGSTLKASRSLFVSQPSISSAIRNLEAELGITIFERMPDGMHATSAGRTLIEGATGIMEQLRQIQSIGQPAKNTCYFRLMHPRYVPAFESFCDLCGKYEAEESLSFSCFLGWGNDSIEAVQKNHCDVAVFIEHTYHNMEDICRQNHLIYKRLAELKMGVQISKDHPLLAEKVFPFEKLQQYPCVIHSELHDFLDGVENGLLVNDIINTQKLIRVQSTTSRVEIVTHTNAFSIVLPHSQEYNAQHSVVTLPLPSLPSVKLGILYSSKRPLSEYAKEYIDLFTERIAHMGIS